MLTVIQTFIITNLLSHYPIWYLSQTLGSTHSSRLSIARARDRQKYEIKYFLQYISIKINIYNSLSFYNKVQPEGLVSLIDSQYPLWGHTQKCVDNPTLKDHVREVSSNDTREQDVPSKRWWDDCAELNAATDKTCKPPKNPRIQSLLDEVINDGPPEKSPPSTISQAIPQNVQEMIPEIIADVIPFESSEKVLLKPPHEIVAEVFPDDVLATPTPEIVAELIQEEEQLEELAGPRTKLRRYNWI